MNRDLTGIGLSTEPAAEPTQTLCRNQGKDGGSALAVCPDSGEVSSAEEITRQLTGGPGTDKFFNSWTLLF